MNKNRIMELSGNKDVQKITKIFYFGTLVGLIIYSIFRIITIPSDNEVMSYSQQNAIRTQHYSFILVAFILFIFYFTTKNRYRESKIMVRHSLKQERDQLDNEEFNNLLRISMNELRYRFLRKQTIMLVSILAISYAIIFTDGILDTLAKIAIFGVIIYYYMAYDEDPEEILGSKNYDRQLVDRDGGLTAASADMRNPR